jgi:hypothetical protein
MGDAGKVEGVGDGWVDEGVNGNVVVVEEEEEEVAMVEEYETDEYDAVDAVGVLHVDGHTLADLDIPYFHLVPFLFWHRGLCRDLLPFHVHVHVRGLCPCLFLYPFLFLCHDRGLFPAPSPYLFPIPYPYPYPSHVASLFPALFLYPYRHSSAHPSLSCSHSLQFQQQAKAIHSQQSTQKRIEYEIDVEIVFEVELVEPP